MKIGLKIKLYVISCEPGANFQEILQKGGTKAAFFMLRFHQPEINEISKLIVCPVCFFSYRGNTIRANQEGELMKYRAA